MTQSQESGLLPPHSKLPIKGDAAVAAFYPGIALQRGRNLDAIALPVRQNGTAQPGQGSQAEVPQVLKCELPTQRHILPQIEAGEVLCQRTERLAGAASAFQRFGYFPLGADIVAIYQRLFVEILITGRGSQEPENLGTKVLRRLTGNGIDLADGAGDLQQLLLQQCVVGDLPFDAANHYPVQEAAVVEHGVRRVEQAVTEE